MSSRIASTGSSKSANLRSLARELNLGLDAFVFLDDNPVECGLMQEMLPEVVTLQLPSPEARGGSWPTSGRSTRPRVTQEDQRRTEMYRQNAEREQLESSAADIGAFLAVAGAADRRRARRPRTTGRASRS